MSEEKDKVDKSKAKQLSRREFLKDAGLVAGGAAVGSMAILSACGTETTITKTNTATTTLTSTATSSMTTTVTAPGSTITQPAATVTVEKVVEVVKQIPKAKGHIIQLTGETECIGCGTCEAVCPLVHSGASGPSVQRIWLERNSFGGVYTIKTCVQCDYPACYYACPKKDEAFVIDEATGIRYINTSKCIPGCQACIEACGAIFDPPRINFDPENRVALICDLCKDREQGPACIQFCPSMCLALNEGGE